MPARRATLLSTSTRTKSGTWDWNNLDFGEDDDDLEEESLKSIEDLRDAKKKVKKRVKAHTGPQWQEKKALLQDLEGLWKDMTPIEFVQILTKVSQEDSLRFLKTLSIKIDPDHYQMKSLIKARNQKCADVIHIVVHDDHLEVVNAEAESAWVHKQLGQLAKHQHLSFAKIFGMCQPHKTEYTFNWTTATQLFSKDPEDQVYMIKALADTGPESGVFTTLPGHAMMQSAWTTVQRHYHIERFFDFLLIFVLWLMGVYFRRQQVTPHWLAVCATILCLRSMAMPLAEFGCAIWFYPGWQVTKFFTVYNIVLFCTEWFSSIVLLYILFEDWGNTSTECKDKTCNLLQHPNLFALVVALKWWHFVLTLLCLKFLGENMLPAFHAVTSKEARAYVLFLVLCFFIVFQAYFVLPIEENMETLGWFTLPWVPTLKVYRLLVLGDFDIFELEGVAADSNARLNGTVIAGDVDDQDIPKVFGNGVRVGFLLASATISVMFMNVGIGLLSSKYDEAKAMKHHIHQSYRAHYTVKLLFWRCILPCKFMSLLCGHDDDLEYDDEGMGIWLAYDGSLLKDQVDETYNQCKTMKKMCTEIQKQLNIDPLS